ncbi:KAT8 regulatory NSL complex subunit 2 [Toxorhynchites rutilus septentrionalis]|uniref:KAT8 regulatory NSL complex subunit 2 n=1 Tax=Toxorhynchites rutilus septentrionalis TaxID=329112 RepID=UPI00247AB468|nr:KAT8 regulatory NSL complex subunit 2 [Toxorhynchites rutilus septentrionalis]
MQEQEQARLKSLGKMSNPRSQQRFRPYQNNTIITASAAGTTISSQATPKITNIIDQEKALRNQIHMEIEKKSKACSNAPYECSLPRLEQYNYCKRHILQDSRAPYKQCAFFFASNGKRCLEPAPKQDHKKDYGTNYCFEHSRLTQLTKTKSTIGKLTPIETTETLLHNLAHHVKVDKSKQPANCSALKITVHEDDEDEELDVVTPSVDPYTDIDVAAINDSTRVVLDYASDSSSDDETTTVGNTWRGYDMDNSDNESVDSQNEDLLKHAGVYTAEEAMIITKEKLTRLQELYTDQFHRLQHVLKEKRRRYLHELRREREQYCSIHDQVKKSPKERKMYEKLKALNHYHRKYGMEAILHRKYLEKRAKATEGLHQKAASYAKCAFTEGGVKCGERTLPCCKFCRKHILEDKKQVLFKSCAVEKSGVVCQEALANIFEDSTCYLHVVLPAQKSFTKKKYESESEGDEELHSEIKKEMLELVKEEKYSPFRSQSSSTTATAAETEDQEMMIDPPIVENNITIVHDEEPDNLEDSLPINVIAKPLPTENSMRPGTPIEEKKAPDEKELPIGTIGTE